MHDLKRVENLIKNSNKLTHGWLFYMNSVQNKSLKELFLKKSFSHNEKTKVKLSKVIKGFIFKMVINIFLSIRGQAREQSW